MTVGEERARHPRYMWQKLREDLKKIFRLRRELNPGPQSLHVITLPLRHHRVLDLYVLWVQCVIVSPLVLAALLVDPLTETNISHFTTTVGA